MDWQGLARIYLIGFGITLSSIGLFDENGTLDLRWCFFFAAIWPFWIVLGAFKFLIRSFYR